MHSLAPSDGVKWQHRSVVTEVINLLSLDVVFLRLLLRPGKKAPIRCHGRGCSQSVAGGPQLWTRRDFHNLKVTKRYILDDMCGENNGHHYRHR